jgi:hypothetical protein
MNLRWLRPGDWLAAIAGVALLVALSLPWYSVTGPVSRELTGWQAFAVIDILLALAALEAVALGVTTAVRRTPAVPVGLGVTTALSGALATLLVLVRVLDPPGSNAVLDVAAGAWIALVAAAGVTAGAWLSIADERNRGVPDPPVEDRPAPPAA